MKKQQPASEPKVVSRRLFLELGAVTVGGVFLSACAPGVGRDGEGSGDGVVTQATGSASASPEATSVPTRGAEATSSPTRGTEATTAPTRRVEATPVPNYEGDGYEGPLWDKMKEKLEGSGYIWNAGTQLNIVAVSRVGDDPSRLLAVVREGGAVDGKEAFARAGDGFVFPGFGEHKSEIVVVTPDGGEQILNSSGGPQVEVDEIGVWDLGQGNGLMAAFGVDASQPIAVMDDEGRWIFWEVYEMFGSGVRVEDGVVYDGDDVVVGKYDFGAGEWVEVGEWYRQEEAVRRVEEVLRDDGYEVVLSGYYPKTGPLNAEMSPDAPFKVLGIGVGETISVQEWDRDMMVRVLGNLPNPNSKTDILTRTTFESARIVEVAVSGEDGEVMSFKSVVFFGHTLNDEGKLVPTTIFMEQVADVDVEKLDPGFVTAALDTHGLIRKLVLFDNTDDFTENDQSRRNLDEFGYDSLGEFAKYMLNEEGAVVGSMPGDGAKPLSYNGLSVPVDGFWPDNRAVLRVLNAVANEWGNRFGSGNGWGEVTVEWPEDEFGEDIDNLIVFKLLLRKLPS